MTERTQIEVNDPDYHGDDEWVLVYDSTRMGRTPIMVQRPVGVSSLERRAADWVEQTHAEYDYSMDDVELWVREAGRPDTAVRVRVTKEVSLNCSGRRL